MKRIFSTILITLLAVLSLISPVFASTDGCENLIGVSTIKPGDNLDIIGAGASIQGTSKPSNVWNLSDNDYYSLSGGSYYHDLYTNYLFTGASQITMNITNTNSTQLKVELYKKGLIDIKVRTVYFTADGDSYFIFPNLNSSSQYYFKFYCPCYFSGNLFKSA